jgi:tetratricopeptide (TPR) repeat protein
LVLTTQRIYLAAARRYADRISDPPAWIARALNDWQDTLDAYERLDRSWLAAHLDAFAKYELFTAVLHESGHTWKDLPAKKELFHELALLDQSYHEFCNPKSVFTRLESAGVLNHRVGPQVLPGQETDPFIPETSTRAQPRARFIREHQGCTEFMIDWSYVVDRKRQLRRQLDDPFAQQFGPWQKSPVDGPSGAPSEALNQVLSKFDQGRYDEADVQLRRFEACFEPLGRSLPTSAVRYRAWLQARRGFTDGPEVLARLYRRGPRSFLQTNDYCCVYRFRGLVPDLEQMEPWIRRGLEQLGNGHSETGDVFRDHVAYTLLRHGRMEQALEVLQPVLTRQSLARICPRMKGRIFSTAGEAWRRLGNRRRASRYLKEAKELQLQHRYFGLLAQFTYASLAKWERTRRMALQWLTKAAVIQTGNRHHLGHANSLLLQARLCRDTQQAESARSKILEYRAALPVLAECTLLGRILEHWDAWTAGENLTEEDDDFWGL